MSKNLAFKHWNPRFSVDMIILGDYICHTTREKWGAVVGTSVRAGAMTKASQPSLGRVHRREQPYQQVVKIIYNIDASSYMSTVEFLMKILVSFFGGSSLTDAYLIITVQELALQ